MTKNSKFYLEDSTKAFKARKNRKLLEFSKDNNISHAKASDMAKIGACSKLIKSLFKKFHIPYSHAFEIAKLPSETEQRLMLLRCYELDLTIRELKSLIDEKNNAKQIKIHKMACLLSSTVNSDDINRVEKILCSSLNRSVDVFHTNKDTGIINISYTSLSDLEELLNKLLVMQSPS